MTSTSSTTSQTSTHIRSTIRSVSISHISSISRSSLGAPCTSSSTTLITSIPSTSYIWVSIASTRTPIPGTCTAITPISSKTHAITRTIPIRGIIPRGTIWGITTASILGLHVPVRIHPTIIRIATRLTKPLITSTTATTHGTASRTRIGIFRKSPLNFNLLTIQIMERLVEQSSLKVKKKVSFNLDVKTYEPLNYADEIDNVYLSEGEEETKWEFDEEETQRANMEPSGEDSSPNVRNRSRYACSVLNPVENLAQWKSIKAKDRLQRKRQKETIISEQERQVPEEAITSFSHSKPLQHEIAVNASLANWLLTTNDELATKV
ncbi:hypothetical protein Leryth_006310 [Lithospermum erythrorhizon]|nr:hypothetical protein Leryth_006310 [Lithospermum erythrorhizon]